MMSGPKQQGRVVDSRNGDWFTSTMMDYSGGTIFFRIMSEPGELLCTIQTRRLLVQCDDKVRLVFNVFKMEKGRAPGASVPRSEMTLDRFARFLQYHIRARELASDVVVVFDERSTDDLS